MSYQVSIKPSDKAFAVETGQSILEAALAENIVLPYGCKDGACGSCKAKVLDGQIDQGPHSMGALKPEEVAQGFALMCCAYPLSDVTVEARVVEGVGDIPIRKMPCRVASMDLPAPDVAVLRLQLPANEQLQYLAGQYVEIILRDGDRREYSMASAPDEAGAIELHIRHMPGGKFTESIFGDAKPPVKEKAILRFEGPMGTFFLREDTEKPIVMVASGTGFAPIKAIVEHMIQKDIRRPIALYWGGRRPHDLYMNALCEQWAAEHEHITYIPVVSDALPEDNWQGRTGFVHSAALADIPDMSGHEVYACGAPIVVDSARAEYTSAGKLPEDAFFADSFTTAADVT